MDRHLSAVADASGFLCFSEWGRGHYDILLCEWQVFFYSARHAEFMADARRARCSISSGLNAAECRIPKRGKERGTLKATRRAMARRRECELAVAFSFSLSLCPRNEPFLT